MTEDRLVHEDKKQCKIINSYCGECGRFIEQNKNERNPFLLVVLATFIIFQIGAFAGSSTVKPKIVQKVEGKWLSNEEIIAETTKCKQAGLKATYTWPDNDGIYAVHCAPRVKK